MGSGPLNNGFGCKTHAKKHDRGIDIFWILHSPGSSKHNSLYFAFVPFTFAAKVDIIYD